MPIGTNRRCASPGSAAIRPEVQTTLEEIEPGRKYKLAVTRAVNLPRRSYPRGMVELAVEDAARPKLRIPITIIVKDKVHLNRRAIVFRPRPGSSPPAEITLLVEKYNDPEFRVMNVACWEEASVTPAIGMTPRESAG